VKFYIFLLLSGLISVNLYGADRTPPRSVSSSREDRLTSITYSSRKKQGITPVGTFKTDPTAVTPEAKFIAMRTQERELRERQMKDIMSGYMLAVSSSDRFK